MYLSYFTFFKNTPLNDFENTIHFKSNEERDNFFLKEKHYSIKEFNQPFNFVRDRLSLRAPISYQDMDGYNYCSFMSGRDGKRYYAFIVGYRYVNEQVTEVQLVIDVVMTFTQGQILNGVRNIKVNRQHLTNAGYTTYLPQLKTNSDVLKTTTKKYVYQDGYYFKEFKVLFQCTADLSKEFGTVNKPKFTTSKGQTYDGITSPVNLYVVDYAKFNELMEVLSKYPWIAQNIKQVQLIPSQFIQSTDLQYVPMATGDFTSLQTFKKDIKSVNFSIPKTITKETLLAKCGIDKKEEHLFRNEYTTIEVYSWDGQQLLLDSGLLSSLGLLFNTVVTLGYTNQVAIYPSGYNSDNRENDITENKEVIIPRGSFLNNALIYNNFADIPILIDNYNLSLANSANTRQLTESKLITNRVRNIVNPKGDITTRIMDSINVLSDVSIGGLFGKFSDEYEFYRQQKAEQLDLSLTTPTVTSQTSGASFQISNGFYGLTVKVSAPTVNELNKVRKYYAKFGFEIEEICDYLSNVESMSITNFVQFSGNWKLNNVDSALMEQLKLLFEKGVNLWHNNGTPNPFNQNLLNNERVM